MAHLCWARLAADVIRQEMAGQARHNHACEVETSIAMSLVPQIVRPDRIGEAVLASSLDPYTEPQTGVVDLPIRFDEWTANGALGDPRRSTVEFGNRIAGVAHERAVGFARRFMYDVYAGEPVADVSPNYRL